MKTIKVKLEQKIVDIKQLPLRRYAELMGAVENLPKNIPAIKGLSGDEIWDKLPALLKGSVPDMIAILAIATDLPKEEVAELAMLPAVQMVAAVIEVNDYRQVYEEIKKVMASTKKTEPEK